MLTSRPLVVLLVAVLSAATLAACVPGSGGGRRTSDRTDPTRTGIPGPGNERRRSVIFRVPCVLSKPVTGAMRRSELEREWKELEAENEKPLREIVTEDYRTKEAVASLDAAILQRHGWTLTKYLVRVMRELHSRSIKEASIQLRNEDYAQQTLHDAGWDGANGWDVVDAVRAETLDLLVGFEAIRTSDTPEAERARSVADHLVNAAKVMDKYSVIGNCKENDDPDVPKDPGTREATFSARA